MKIAVKFRKLGREKAFGLAHGHLHGGKWLPSGLVEIDPRQTSRELMDTATHESLHLMNPSMSEKEVKRQAKLIAKILWDMNFRRVEK